MIWKFVWSSIICFRFTFRRFIEEDINYDKFKANKNKGSKKGFKIPNAEVMVIDSSYDRGGIKKRILRDNLIPYICNICGMGNEWQLKPLVLVLDHINGKGNDHRLENLRFLCPNCNSQTETFAARNKAYRNNG